MSLQNVLPFCGFCDIVCLPGNHNKIPQKGWNEGSYSENPAMATSGLGYADSVYDAEARSIGGIGILNIGCH